MRTARIDPEAVFSKAEQAVLDQAIESYCRQKEALEAFSNTDGRMLMNTIVYPIRKAKVALVKPVARNLDRSRINISTQSRNFYEDYKNQAQTFQTEFK